MYIVYAYVDQDDRVIKITTSKYEENPPENCKPIGESDDPDAFEEYIVYDEIGASNYKYVEGSIVERTEEEKEHDHKTIQERDLEFRYIPNFSDSLNIFLQYFMKKESGNYDVDMKLKLSGIYKNWSLGKYEVGDICNHAGQTWECWTAHDNASNPDITPDKPQTWANFWRPLHGTSVETARPWVKPQNGTTDMYHIGEYMVWTDGTIKKCLRDTVYSPDEYAADWEQVSTS